MYFISGVHFINQTHYLKNKKKNTLFLKKNLQRCNTPETTSKDFLFVNGNLQWGMGN